MHARTLCARMRMRARTSTSWHVFPTPKLACDSRVRVCLNPGSLPPPSPRVRRPCGGVRQGWATRPPAYTGGICKSTADPCVWVLMSVRHASSEKWVRQRTVSEHQALATHATAGTAKVDVVREKPGPRHEFRGPQKSLRLRSVPEPSTRLMMCTLVSPRLSVIMATLSSAAGRQPHLSNFQVSDIAAYAHQDTADVDARARSVHPTGVGAPRCHGPRVPPRAAAATPGPRSRGQHPNPAQTRPPDQR